MHGNTLGVLNEGECYPVLPLQYEDMPFTNNNVLTSKNTFGTLDQFKDKR